MLARSDRTLAWTLMVLVGAACATRGTAPPRQGPEELRAAATQRVLTDVPQLPRPVTSFGAALFQGAVYALGGYFGVPHAYSREGQSGELLRFDPSSGRFQSLWHGEGVQGAQLVSSAKGVVRVGGMRATNAQGEPEQLRSLADVALWDEGASTWRALPAMPEGRSSHAAVVLSDKLYVIGGWTLSGARGGGTFADSVLVLDLATNVYRRLPQPFRARAHAAAVLEDKIVVIGGIDEGGHVKRSVHVLDPSDGSWASAADYPDDAFGIAVSSSGGSLVASGRDGVVRCLAQLSSSFEPCARLAFPRFFHQLVALGDGRVAALGGISGMHGGARIAHVELLAPHDSAARVLSFSLQNPGAAKNRQGIAGAGDSLLMFGGNRSLGQHDFAPDDFVDEAFELDLANMQTRRLPSFPERRQTVQTLAMEGGVLALGGFGHDGARARAHSDAYLFDAEREAWTPYGSVLPAPRTQFGLALHDATLWVFGGLDFDPSRGENDQFRHPVEVLRATPGAPFVASGLVLPHPRRAFGGALLEGRYYLVGGMADGFSSVPSCDVLDLASSRWSSVACPAPRISPQLTALDGKLYLAGGSSPGEGGQLVPNRRLEVFDPKAERWSTLVEELPIEPRHLSVVAYRHALILESTHQTDGSLKLLVVVPPG